MYAAIEDLFVKFNQEEIEALAPIDSGDGIDHDRITDALVAADGEINSYLAVRYLVPVDAPQIKPIACDIARYHLYDNDAPEQVEKRYKQRLAWLKDIASNKATLGIAEAQSSGSSNVVVKRDSSDRLFTRDEMSSY